MRYLAKISYNGRGFCGWQIQKNERTVQAELETALQKIAKAPISVVAAGRTDAGVHALGQQVHFDFQQKMEPQQILRAIQTNLPPDIKIENVMPVCSDFHARFDAVRRCYKYYITKTPTPFNRYYRAFFPGIDIDPFFFRACAEHLIGKHDFSSFAKFNPDIKSAVCNLQELSISLENDDIVLTFTADRFLHNMVRRIVGCQINLIRTAAPPDTMATLLAAKQPDSRMISTAPACGLYLFEVCYPEVFFI